MNISTLRFDRSHYAYGILFQDSMRDDFKNHWGARRAMRDLWIRLEGKVEIVLLDHVGNILFGCEP